MKDSDQCLIVGACPSLSPSLIKECVPAHGEKMLVVAADGGLLPLRHAGITPTALIGDFDSLTRAGLHRSDVSDIPNIVNLPKEKDDIDLVSAAEWAWDHHGRFFTFLGALGGRPALSFAALQLAAHISQAGGFALLRTEKWTVATVCNGELLLTRSERSITPIAVMAITDSCEGVTLTGLRYVLHDATFTNTSSRWTSNESIAGQAPSISVHRGILAVFWPKGLGVSQWTSWRREAPSAHLGFLEKKKSCNLAGKL